MGSLYFFYSSVLRILQIKESLLKMKMEGEMDEGKMPSKGEPTMGKGWLNTINGKLADTQTNMVP